MTGVFHTASFNFLPGV